jgi:hypothetical protein
VRRAAEPHKSFERDHGLTVTKEEKGADMKGTQNKEALIIEMLPKVIRGIGGGRSKIQVKNKQTERCNSC